MEGELVDDVAVGYPDHPTKQQKRDVKELVAFPNWVPISRTTMKRDVTKLYEVEKKKLKEYFKGVPSVALTTDMWTSNQQIGYISITAHFIDHSWTLQKRIIGFSQVEPPHTGKNLANVIAKNIQEWEIKKKIISITVDNASSNDVLVRTLKEILEKSGVSLYQGGKFFHVRCCAHILNLMVQDGLSTIRDELGKIREAVKYIKCSPSRLHNFEVIVDEFEMHGKKKLVLDVSTRWNSTYLMLEIALMHRHGRTDNVHFQASKSELDMYLEDGLLKCDVTAHDSFDILIWWKDKELKYPILSHMARDILCIPITSVAFESAFSTGGRIVDESRSSLSPKTVEELVCAGDWIKQYGDPMNLVPVLPKISTKMHEGETIRINVKNKPSTGTGMLSAAACWNSWWIIWNWESWRCFCHKMT
ncbi:putative AC transposase [Nymphaea thermarum]|nr:putative AC transposase [Nymphaea thermarum]